MKRLTKEWNTQLSQVMICKAIQPYYGENDNPEEAYARLYKRAKKRYIEETRQAPIYYDARADLRRLDRAISSRSTTPEEKERKKQERATFIYNHKEELENGPKYVFDEVAVGRAFNRIVKYNESVIRSLPEAFLAKRSAPKILALGYGTPKDVTAMRKFSKVTMEVVMQALDVAVDLRDKAAENLPEEVDFDIFQQRVLLSMKNDDRDIVLTFDDRVMRLHNAKIIEQEKTEILPYDENEPFKSSTRVLAIELECDEKTTRFTLSFLMENRTSALDCEMWYLTFGCDNITATLSAEELEELRQAVELQEKLKEIVDGLTFDVNHEGGVMDFVMGEKVVSIPINETSQFFLFEHFQKLVEEIEEYYK